MSWILDLSILLSICRAYIYFEVYILSLVCWKSADGDFPATGRLEKRETALDRSSWRRCASFCGEEDQFLTFSGHKLSERAERYFFNGLQIHLHENWPSTVAGVGVGVVGGVGVCWWCSTPKYCLLLCFSAIYVVTCCNIYREYAPVVFTLSYVRASILLVPSLKIVFHMKCNQIQFLYCMDDIFCSILFYSV